MVHASSQWLEHEPVPDDQSLGGSPHTGVAELGQFGGLDVGVWEMTPGVMSDVEADEVFVVLAGDATVTFDDGSAPIDLRPGSLVRLHAGQHTTWTVRETLRKVYVA